MVGNDVVDLRDPESRPESVHPRFDARVFSPSERRAISDCADAGVHRWRLWAAKEACFKVARKLDSSTPFVPRHFRVEGFRNDLGTAWVRHAERLFRVVLDQNAAYIHAIALPEGLREERVISGLAQIDASESESGAVRSLARRGVAAALGIALESLEVRKEARIPRLFVGGLRAEADLSLSHHGGFVAFACTSEVRA